MNVWEFLSKNARIIAWVIVALAIIIAAILGVTFPLPPMPDGGSATPVAPAAAAFIALL